LSNLDIDTNRNQIEFQLNKFKSSKYTLFSFLPLNLLEQFRRAANFYFLVTMVLTWVIDAPISPESWLLSLMFVVVITMIKQGYEDYLRHKEDNRANRRKVSVIRKGGLAVINSENIKVGDILYLTEDQEVPCDVIVLSSSQEQGQCYVMTANLDGETSLKTRCSTALTKQAKTTKQICSLNGCIECENPNPKLDSFLGRLSLWSCQEGDEIEACPLGNDNLLLAGTVLKNTKEVYACCVYAGTQTKISLNSKITKNKFSTIEKSLNRYLIFFVAILLTEMVASTILSFSFDFEFYKGTDLYLFSLGKVLHFFGANKEAFLNMTNIKRTEHRDNLPSILGYEVAKDYPHALYIQNQKVWYLDQFDEITFVRILEMFLLWMVLYNYIIPLSMYVSLEIQKFIASKQFQWDRQLYDEERDQPAICHTSDINEELGLVTHLFSDKTGTITKNEMILKMFCDNGHVFEVEDSPVLKWNHFMTVLCLCHSVQVSEGEFVASSPDEKAILEFCREQNFVFNGEYVDGKLVVTAKGIRHTYEKLAELPFDSFRKCMTVIVKDIDNVIHVLSKGAESTMLEACTSGDIDSTEQYINDFANIGLRTLVLGYKTITMEQYEAFDNALQTSSQSFVNRAKFVREVYQGMERDLQLIGATGIEDKLQDDVVETIQDLKTAGIKVWMLTGDKKETAINLGHSAGLLSANCALIDLCDNSDPRDVTTLIAEVAEENSNTIDGKTPSLVIDGKSVASLFKNTESLKHLEKLASKCETVIACRLSPIQKSQLVRMMKSADPSNLTAAIGDGGNDVSMLQEAHIGLAIIGKEGTAAAQASDFAFTKFKYLRRAFLVHGHWYYIRASFLIQFSFYKNIACFTGQLFYMFYTNYSAQTLFESTFLVLYNTIYTAVPCMIYAILEQNIPETTLMANPRLYRNNCHNTLMSRYYLVKWILLGIWHSLVSFFMSIFLYENLQSSDRDIKSLQTIVAQSVVFIVNFKVLIDSKHWNLILILSVLFSSLSYCLFTFFVHFVFKYDNFFFNSSYYLVYIDLLADPSMWLCTLITIVIALLPDFLIQIFKDFPFQNKPKYNKTVPFVDPVI